MPLSYFWIGMDLPCFRNTPVSFFDKSVKAEPAMAVFRKVFHLADVPKELTARFSGDCKYRLWINGQFVDDGPVEIGGDYANYGSRVNSVGTVHLTFRIRWVGPGAWRTQGDMFSYEYQVQPFGVTVAPRLLEQQ